MASSSSIDSPLHLDLDPLMQRLVALIQANDSLACVQCNVVLYFWSHLVASLSANQLKKASLSANRLIFICLYLFVLGLALVLAVNATVASRISKIVIKKRK